MSEEHARAVPSGGSRFASLAPSRGVAVAPWAERGVLHVAARRAMDSAAADGAGGQLVDSAGWHEGKTSRAREGAAHDLPTVALDSASRCPQPLGQPAPARRVAISTHVRARVAHTAHSPHDDRIEDFSEKGPLRAVRKGAPTGVASRAHEWPAPEVVA